MGISRQESSVKVKCGLSYESYSNIRKRNALSEKHRDLSQFDSNVGNTVYKTHTQENDETYFLVKATRCSCIFALCLSDICYNIWSLILHLK